MRIATLHLRTSFTRWAVLPLAILGTFILFQRNTFWIGIWPEAGAAVVVSAFFFSLFSAGLSAWVSARTDVYRMREQTAAAVHPPAVLEMLRFAASLAWLVLAYAVQVIVAAVLTAQEGAPGVPFYIGYTLLGLFLIVMSAAWGWMFGRLMNPAIAAAAAFFSWFIFLSVVGPISNADPNSGPAWIAIDTSMVVARLVVLSVFCLAVCLLSSKNAVKGPAVGLLAVGLTLAAVVATMLSTTVLGPRTPVASPLCVDRTITYCLWPEHQKFVPLVEEIDAQVAALPLDLKLPTRIVDYSLSGSSVWDEDGIEIGQEGTFDPEFSINAGSRWALARSVSLVIAVGIFDDCIEARTEDPELASEQLWAWLEFRLAGGGTVDYVTNAEGGLQAAWAKGAQAARDLDDAQQAAWAAELITVTTEKYCSAP